MLEALELDRQLRLGLDALRYAEATEVQAIVVPAVLAGGDLLVSAETGSGKTLAYLVPLTQKILSSRSRNEPGTLALVIVPTRELARQVVKVCDRLFSRSPLKAAAITGGADLKYQKSLLRKDPEVLVATPGRLLEHLRAGSADLGALQTLVLDEADRMLDLDLRDDVLAIAERCNASAQRLLVSATLTHPGIGDLSDRLLDSPRKFVSGPEKAAHGAITHELILADSHNHKDKLLKALLTGESLHRALVFCNRRKTAERLAAMLGELQLRCACLHGELSTEERKKVVHQFHEDKVSILCATDVAARGLDVEGIDAVINYDFPHSGDDYVHRTGRTGRAGAIGLAVSLVAAGEWKLLTGTERYLGLTMQRRSLPGLKARYNGPPATADEASGKKRGSGTPTRDKPPRNARQKANKGGSRNTSNDGLGPLKKKKPG